MSSHWQCTLHSPPPRSRQHTLHSEGAWGEGAAHPRHLFQRAEMKLLGRLVAEAEILRHLFCFYNSPSQAVSSFRTTHQDLNSCLANKDPLLHCPWLIFF